MILTLALVNVILATRTRFASKVLEIKTWSTALAVGSLLLGEFEDPGCVVG